MSFVCNYCDNEQVVLSVQKDYIVIESCKCNGIAKRISRFLDGFPSWHRACLEGKDTSIRLILHGSWGWFLETKNKSYFKFVSYTWRHRVRLWIGIDGNMGGGEYTFKKVKFRGRLHNFLNWML